MISGVSLSEAGAASGETLTVTLGDANGLLSATSEGVTGSGSLFAVTAAFTTLSDTDATTTCTLICSETPRAV